MDSTIEQVGRKALSGWISTEDAMPDEGQEVTIFLSPIGQIRQVIKDKTFSGGWKQANCTGWECVTLYGPSVTHWRLEIFERPR